MSSQIFYNQTNDETGEVGSRITTYDQVCRLNEKKTWFVTGNFVVGLVKKMIFF